MNLPQLTEPMRFLDRVVGSVGGVWAWPGVGDRVGVVFIVAGVVREFCDASELMLLARS